MTTSTVPVQPTATGILTVAPVDPPTVGPVAFKVPTSSRPAVQALTSEASAAPGHLPAAQALVTKDMSGLRALDHAIVDLFDHSGTHDPEATHQSSSFGWLLALRARRRSAAGHRA